jgi:SAM-dependent methyltransferase
MDTIYEVKYHQLEDIHWWFRARRRKVLDYVQVSPAARYLDIGCSTGMLLSELISRGADPDSVYGVDISESAIGTCVERGLKHAHVMDAASITFDKESFDCIVSSDCLEHLEDDNKALNNWYGLLKPGGRLVVFVPAFMSLWSPHDVVNHHYRRYERGELAKKMEAAGFTVQDQGYWNFTLFFPIFIFRLIKKVFFNISEQTPQEDLKRPNLLINKLLFGLLALENRLLKHLHFPIGVSTYCICTKK